MEKGMSLEVTLNGWVGANASEMGRSEVNIFDASFHISSGMTSPALQLRGETMSVDSTAADGIPFPSSSSVLMVLEIGPALIAVEGVNIFLSAL